MKKRAAGVVKAALISIVSFIIIFVFCVGPWPVYRSSSFQSKAYYARAVEEIHRQAGSSAESSGPLKAGWASEELHLPDGTPLAGYGARKGKPAAGTHDPLFVKAVALDNSLNRIVIVGSDLLIVPPNVADRVRSRASEELALPAEAILFNASHTHSGPGGGSRELLARFFAGRFRKEVETVTVNAFVSAVAAACEELEEADIRWGRIAAPGFIRNRTREQTVSTSLVDDDLDYVLLKKRTGQCLLVRYSAHPTVIGAENMLYSGDFPGYLQRYLEDQGLESAVYLAGAVGSMGPKIEQGGNDFEKAHYMGVSLARLVLEDIRKSPKSLFRSEIRLQCIGFPVMMPPLQMRISRSWRLSPVFLRMSGVRRKTWLTAVALDELLLFALPCDLSGEISSDWKEKAGSWQIELVPLSFNGAYAGYISPDAYYGEVYEEGRLAYETAIMSWCGPDQGAYVTALFDEVLKSLYKGCD